MSIRSVLDNEMSLIQDDVLRMSSLVEKALGESFHAFREHDYSAAQISQSTDDQIDELHSKIEDSITATVARHQPAARDLRTLIANLLISNELERMGDHAEGLSKMVLRKENEVGGQIANELIDMVAKVSEMQREAMRAYVEGDTESAKMIAVKDDEVDLLYRRLFERIVNAMHDGECPVAWGTYLLWAGHSLERIGDRITNICERIIYAQTGDKEGLND